MSALAALDEKTSGDIMAALALARQDVPPSFAAFLSLLLLASPEAVAEPPVASAQAEFQRLHPCPANDARQGDCPGYVIDYVVPLCMGGPDVAYNMRWQTVAEAKARDAVAVRRCPASRNGGQIETRLVL
jgi:hypothetical protein